MCAALHRARGVLRRRGGWRNAPAARARQAERGGDAGRHHRQDEQRAFVARRRPPEAEHDDEVDADHDAAQTRERDAVREHPVGPPHQPARCRDERQRQQERCDGDRGNHVFGPAHQHTHGGDDHRDFGGNRERTSEPLHALTLTYRRPPVPRVGDGEPDDRGHDDLERDRPPGQRRARGPEQHADDRADRIPHGDDCALGAAFERAIGDGDQNVQTRERSQADDDTRHQCGGRPGHRGRGGARRRARRQHHQQEAEWFRGRRTVSTTPAISHASTTAASTKKWRRSAPGSARATPTPTSARAGARAAAGRASPARGRAARSGHLSRAPDRARSPRQAPFSMRPSRIRTSRLAASATD